MIRKLFTFLLAILAVAAIYIYMFHLKPKLPTTMDTEEAIRNGINIALAGKDYETAKELTDSLSKTYPLDPNIQSEAEQKKIAIELAMHTDSIESIKKKIAEMKKMRDDMLPYFTFNKDTLYQDIGYYTIPAQSKDEKDYNRCYLGAQVDEEGTASFTSYYVGKAINHNRVKVSMGETYVECDNPLSSFSNDHLGTSSEKVTFAYDGDDGVMNFIASFNGPFKVELIGSKSYSYTLNDEDRDAFYKIIALSRIFKEIQQGEQLLGEVQRAANFLEIKKENIKKE